MCSIYVRCYLRPNECYWISRRSGHTNILCNVCFYHSWISVHDWSENGRKIHESQICFPSDHPRLYSIVDELSRKAGMEKPKIGISSVPIPNAFAFGKKKRDSRICVTSELLDRLNDDELRAVLGHEISHIRHRDVVVITALSVIPLICYFVFYSFLFSGMGEEEMPQQRWQLHWLHLSYIS